MRLKRYFWIACLVVGTIFLGINLTTIKAADDPEEVTFDGSTPIVFYRRNIKYEFDGYRILDSPLPEESYGYDYGTQHFILIHLKATLGKDADDFDAYSNFNVLSGPNLEDLAEGLDKGDKVSGWGTLINEKNYSAVEINKSDFDGQLVFKVMPFDTIKFAYINHGFGPNKMILLQKAKSKNGVTED